MTDEHPNVVKRDGTVVPYSEEKIVTVIEKAFNATQQSITPKQINKLLANISIYDGISVEEIQKQVQESLMKEGFYETAAAFVIYRAEHNETRFIRERLDYMDQYSNSTINAASASETDANANVTMKNVANLEGETYKKENRKIQRQRMKDKLNELFPEVAKQYEKDLNNHIIYAHDEATTPTSKFYTYSPFECIEAIYNGCHYLLGLKSLYCLVQGKEVLENEAEEVWCKYPIGLQIKDKTGWVNVVRLTRKKKQRDLYRIKTAFGEDIIVTDNHPMIISDDQNSTIEAINCLNEKQYRIENNISFEGIDTIDLSLYVECDKVCSNFIATHEKNAPYYYAKRYLKLDRSLGYVIGFFIGDGNYDNTYDIIMFSQKERETLIHLEESLFESFGVVSYETIGYGNSSNNWIMKVCSKIVSSVFRNYFGIKDKSSNKCLPTNILMFNEDFARGVIEGLIDSDGTVQSGSTILIRLSSRECITQLTKLLRYFGYGVSNQHQATPFGNNPKIKTNYDLWGILFTNQTGSVKFDGSYKWNQGITTEVTKSLKYSTGWSSITNVDKIDNGSFLEKCEYIYDITTESGTFDCNNLWVHNCAAVSTYPLLLEGSGNIDGVTPSAPNDIQSFCGQITNLVFLLSSQCRGAVAVGDLFISMNYCIIQEFGEKWYDKLDCIVTTDHCIKQRTIKDMIRKGMKQFIYGINQPAGNRSYNSPFSNVQYCDENYYNALFKDYYYPDGTRPEWKAIDTLQRIFMELHRELRLIKPLTFPVSTMALLHDGNDIIDQEYKKLCAEEWAKGGSFFCYLSDNPEVLSSCCFSGDTEFLWKSSTAGVNLTSFKDFYEHNHNQYKENFKVYHNGSWVIGKVVKLPNRPMYKITTFNNKEFCMTDNHINVTLNGEKTTENLTTDDYLMFSTIGTYPITENDEHLTYEQGFAVGSFLGDGSFGATNPNTNIIYDIYFSQNVHKYEHCMEVIDKANQQVGGENKSCLSNIHNNVYPVRISSKHLVAFIQKWTNWKRGTYSYNKELNLNCLTQSYEFRKGILDGWYHTDGGNSNRCYTTSPQLAKDMEILIMSLGMQSIINVYDRTNEDVIIRNEVYNRNYPLYCVRWYEPTNQRSNRDSQHAWIKKNNSIYFRVKSIERVDYVGDTYCIECKNEEEPYFTLPCGLITHNCRVQNQITGNTFSSTIGLLGLMTGSANVITLNINRILQNWAKDFDLTFRSNKEEFKKYLVDVLERVYKYQIAYKTILYDMEDKGMYSCCNANYIRISKLYCTIGIIGYCEAAQFLGYEVNNNKDYTEFLKFIFNIIKEENQKHSIYDAKRPFVFNLEAIPGESLAVKLYNWDKNDGYIVPEDQNLYSSYFFKQWDNHITILDKLRLHGGEVAEACSGGQACHIHLDEHLSATQYSKIIDFCIKERVNYFTFNIPMSECKDCGHTVNAPVKECPKCKSTNIDWWVRIIGYLRPISAWSKDRQMEASKRIYSNGKKEIA